MHIPVTCDDCGFKFKVEAHFAGHKGKCSIPECRCVYAGVQPVMNEGQALATPSRSVRRLPILSRPQPQSRRPFAQLISVGVAAVVLLGAVIVWPLAFVKLSDAAPEPAAEVKPEVVDFAMTVTPFAKKYCADCHEGDNAEAGIRFSKYSDEKSMLKDRRTWQRTFEILSQGTMPPPDSPQPTPDEKSKIVDYLDEKLHHIDCSKIADPGRVTIRRLNRSEYNNTIRDLMGVEFRPAEDFPTDDVGYGFDNIGDVLSLPPLLMEKYLAAAEKIAQDAVLLIDTANPPRRDFDRNRFVKGSAAKPHGDDGVVLPSVGEFSVNYDPPRSGQYILHVMAAETPGGDEASKMEFRIDNKAVSTFEVSVTEANYTAFDVPLHLDRGRRKFAVAFLNDYYDEKAEDPNRRDRNLLVKDVQIIGPIEIDADQYPWFHRTYLKSFPADGKSVADAARENLRPFAARAFRRPVTDQEVERFVRIAEQVSEQGDSFLAAMQVAVSGVLVSPHFLFRIETDKHPHDANERHTLTEYELATRLSYFLWSSLPDDELLAHAGKGDLHTDVVIEQQVRRMLADPRSQALVDNFAEQWLQLRILNEITPDRKKFPEFKANLRDDMKRETLLFFEHIMRQDSSVLDFLDARYTFLNERLSKHYGIPEITGPEFRPVSLAGHNRAGLLTQGSILTMTSNPDRTSPVKRGKWVMEVILDQPPPPPPPNVPELTETSKAKPDLTLRQQLELHRENASCASCHRVMDQLGFGMENFDAIGRWRNMDGKQLLDTRGELPGGASFTGPTELATVLRSKQTEFCEGLTEKMLTYGLGRGLEYYDQCATDRIVRSLKDRDFKFSVLVTEIAKSEPFRMRRGEDAQ